MTTDALWKYRTEQDRTERGLSRIEAEIMALDSQYAPVEVGLMVNETLGKGACIVTT